MDRQDRYLAFSIDLARDATPNGEDILCDTVIFTYLIEFHILDKGFDNFYQVLINKEIINSAIKSNKQITLNLYDFDKVENKDLKKVNEEAGFIELYSFLDNRKNPSENEY